MQELLKNFYYIREFIVLDVGENKRRIYIPDPLRFGTLLCTYGYFNLMPTVNTRRPSHYMDIIMRILKRYPEVIGFINKPNTIQNIITNYKPIYLFIGFQEVKQEFEAGIKENEKQDYSNYKAKFGKVNAIKEFECNGILYELVGQTVCNGSGRHSGNVFMLSRGEKPFDHNDEETFDIPILFDSVEALGGMHGGIYYSWYLYLNPRKVNSTSAFFSSYGTDLALYVRKNDTTQTERSPLKVTKWFNLVNVTDKINYSNEEREYNFRENPIVGHKRIYLGGNKSLTNVIQIILAILLICIIVILLINIYRIWSFKNKYESHSYFDH